MTVWDRIVAMIRRVAACLLLMAAVLPAQAPPYLSQLPTGEDWVAHLKNDLMPFYSVASALGDPVGQFPSTRCDDGSLLDFQNPCAPIAGNFYLMSPNRYLVPMSRQTYGYGVAFHMTGDVRYLNWMKAGVDAIRKQFMDRTNGGMYLQMDLNTKQWGPDAAYRDPQQLGYGLLGMAFYYYLTRDAAVLPDIVAMQRYIYASYWNPSLGSMQWLLKSQGSSAFDQLQLTACLDQMNTYLVLLAPIVPEPFRTEMKDEMRVLVKAMISIFYSPVANLYFTSANAPRDTDPQKTGVDVGHTSKALWMSRFAGLINGDANLVAWAEANARRHLARCWIDSDGSWAAGVVSGGALDLNKNWWVYSELDQLAGTLSLENSSDGAYLPRSASYWFTYFVDHQYGDVWNGVSYGTNAPQKDYPKAWQWKNAYHAFEHALVGYISAQQMRQAAFPLYFAFTGDVPASSISPYYLRAEVDHIDVVSNSKSDTGGPNLQKVTFIGKANYDAPARAVSAASFLAAPLASSSMGTVFGERFAGASVSITDQAGVVRPAIVTGSTTTQVNFVLPPQLAGGAATITVKPVSGSPVSASTNIAPVSPAVFQFDAGTALVAANVIRVRADGTQSIEPIAAGISFGAASGTGTDRIFLAIYGSGIRGASTVTATLRGQDVPVLYAGPQGIAGLDQVNIGPLPRSLAGRGSVTILLTADGLTANAVQASFQ
jgi:uncharacterized protein (TIGR03437 family)